MNQMNHLNQSERNFFYHLGKCESSHLWLHELQPLFPIDQPVLEMCFIKSAILFSLTDREGPEPFKHFFAHTCAVANVICLNVHSLLKSLELRIIITSKPIS